MSSHAQDQATQTAASTGAQQQDTQLAANAAQNQAFANQARSTLFGTYDPATNQYSGGTESQYLNPSSQDTNNLTGAYQNEYNTVANQNAQGAQRAVQTSQMQGYNQGQGKTPVGYQADQARQAYQTQANNNATAYSGLFGQQHAEDVSNYQNANNMLNSNSTGASNLSLQGNSAAAGNYNGLYGTASQQTPTALGTILGTAGTLAGAAATAYAGKGCWIAAELYGGWFEPRTMLVREWLHEEVSKTRAGRFILDIYMRFGARVAELIKTKRWLRGIFQRIFDAAFSRAVRWKEGV